MKRLLPFLVAVLAMAACKKDGTVKLTLKTRCQHCEVRVNTGGDDVVYDSWYGPNDYDVVAEKGETVRVQMNWRSVPNDTVWNQQHTGVVSIQYWDSIPYSMSAWLYNGGTLPLTSGGCESPQTSCSFSAKVPD